MANNVSMGVRVIKSIEGPFISYLNPITGFIWEFHKGTKGVILSAQLKDTSSHSLYYLYDDHEQIKKIFIEVDRNSI